MHSWECRPYIFFLREEQAAFVVYEENRSTEPLFSQMEIILALTGLCKLGHIDVFTSEVLQVCARQVPIREEGIRPRLISEGIEIRVIRFFSKDDAPFGVEGGEMLAPKAPHVM